MTAVTRKDVIETLGELDDVTVANIMETRATPQELAEAQAWLANDEALIKHRQAAPNWRRREGAGRHAARLTRAMLRSPAEFLDSSR
jgi:hypothetical protein